MPITLMAELASVEAEQRKFTWRSVLASVQSAIFSHYTRSAERAWHGLNGRYCTCTRT